MDWEDWLRAAAKRPSDHEDSKRERTESQIRDALACFEPLNGRPYRVFAKGSYANNTNVRLNYDVDIAVEYLGYFYSDLMFDLKGKDKSEVGVVSSSDTYSTGEFKADILAALEKAFGSSAVTAGNIAYRVRERKTTLPADVVPSWQYRRYDKIVNGVPVFQLGCKVFPAKGSPAINYPQQQLDNGISKNSRTARRYKRMVRALKKLQTRLVDEGVLDKELPSYLMECLVYNVPDDKFNHTTYKADMRSVLASLFNETLSSGNCQEWHEVNGLKYLFKGERPWTVAEVHTMASESWDYLGFE